MTGRQRLVAVMNGEPVDRLAWTVLVDDNTLSALPDRAVAHSGIEFARHLGCDILQLEGWGTPHSFRSPALEWGADATETRYTDGGDEIRDLRGPRGTLRSVCRRGHPVRYPVETLSDVRAYTALWESARYVPRDDRSATDAVDRMVGDDGLVMRFWGPSTIPRLLQYDIGVAPFYYLLQDHRRDMERLIATMHERELEAFKILAGGPCAVVALVENTSTAYISPDVYRRYNGPHVRDFVEAVHAAGKTAIVHMCGHIKGLLPLIGHTGLDGIHALTPPPTGDTPWEMALDALGAGTVIVGLLDPSVFVQGPVEAIGGALERLYSPRLRASSVILCLAADGLTVSVDRFEAVARWMAAHADTPAG